MITVHPTGRLGNLMFQYAMSRILAYKYLHNTDFGLTNQFAYCEKVTDLEITAIGMGYKRKGTLTLEGHDIDLDDPTFKVMNLHLHGYFQNYNYYKDTKPQWQMCFLQPIKYSPSYDLVVHVRGGDLYSKSPNAQHVPCPYHYYDDIISRGYESLFIATDDPEDPIVLKIKKNFPDAAIGGKYVMRDYAAIYDAKRIVLSLSTFAWWAAWLGEAEEVHFPELGFWHPKSKRTEVNLHVDEDRYRYHDLGVYDDWTASNEQIKNLMK